MAEIVCKSCESADCKNLQRDTMLLANGGETMEIEKLIAELKSIKCTVVHDDDGQNLTADDWRLMLQAADEQGRLVFLPVKAGDTVYQLRDKKHALGVGVHPRHISCVRVYGNYWIAEHQGDKPCAKKDFGKTWFLTREAAEAALKEYNEKIL